METTDVIQFYIAERGDPRAINTPEAEENFLSLSRVKELYKDSCKDGVFTVLDPAGGAHTFTLDRWEGRDPDQTFVQLAFRARNVESLLRHAPTFP